MNRADKIIAIVVSVILLGALVVGFWLSGSPFALENQKLDGIRLRDFTSIDGAIQQYANTNGALPASVSDLPSNFQSEDKDPSTGKAFDYSVTSSSTFNLCANFSDDSSNEAGRTNYYGYGGSAETHTKGYDCVPFTITISPAADRAPIAPPPSSAPCNFSAIQIPMTAVATGVSFGLTGDSTNATATPGGVPESVTSVCLGWRDTLSGTVKTYSIFRGYGQYNLPVSKMTEVMVVSSSIHTFLDPDAGKNPCYAVEINDGKGNVYTSADACF